MRRDSDEGFAEPLDAADPRFAGSEEARTVSPRRLVASRGPGISRMDPRVRALRVLIPVAFCIVIALVIVVFVSGLDPGDGRQVLGPETAVRAAVADRPRHVCYEDGQPCAWLTVVDGELLALTAAGPLGGESGRFGVAWCASSGYFGANATGSRFDPRGNVVEGPAPRGLDRFGLDVDDAQRVIIDFFSLRTGLQAGRADELIPPTGPDCGQIPFDRDAPLQLGS